MRTPRNTPGSPGRNGPEAASAPPVRGRRAHAGPPADEQPDEGPTAPADISLPPESGPVWQLRPRRVRAKIVCLLMVPVVSLIALWAYATVTTAQDVSRLSQLQRVDETVRTPVASVVAELQAERAAAIAYAARPDDSRADELRGQAAQTDKALGKLRLGKTHTVADGADLPSGVATRLGSFVDDADGLAALRETVLDRRTGWDEAYDKYTETIGKAFAVGGALTGVQDAEVGSDARVVLEFSRAAEMLAREDALLSTAQLTKTLEGARLQSFIGAVETRRTLLGSAVQDLRGEERDAWRELEKGSAYADVLAVEDKVLAAPSGAKAADAIDAGVWDKAYTEVQDELRGIETDAGQRAADRADPFARGVLTPAGAAVLLGLIAVAASLVISVRIGRALVVELVSLRNTALEIARRKLPSAMRRLRAGEDIDIQAEAPPGPPAQDEIGQVSESLGTVHRAALSAAIERAELASGISGVFVNLARRSQVLVHRQLNLLDSMERRAEDPNELSDLFRLDHLTTRMRRHAESLIILSGAAPGRAWRMPVSLTNVVRAAVSEVEDYARVEVRQLPESAVVGAAVADLTHLLAELVENAASFSPPHTKVRVSGEPVGNGYALEVEDRGLGMGKERLAEANRRIEQSEALDLFDSDRLGLFVVSRLAARHGIKVHLRTSPYGGTTAVVLLPTALLQDSLPKGGGRPAPEEIEPAAEHARVPGAGPLREVGGGAPVPGPRPALAAMPEAPAPRGVTALRLHTRTSEEQTPPRNGAAAQPAADEDATADLPRRVRQANLAPQLREEPAPEAPEPPAQAQGTEERTPEQVRDRMTAYRDGWTRGGGRPAGRRSDETPDFTPGSAGELRTPGSNREGDHA
ncbi:sensor histidine kinase [Streptomyces sp. TRM66268-LWL]|uniref:histidine kinase n=1 Tax=Streptomyces polyasparticus TaxID=2767826 RepID=A0ABR7SPQ5_9ACTN|nr:sensor histidine kinase [Streptomyces polyasparticus]MBC9717471.1 sensor histidine kinase [Streptomyces polyasparticus]